MAIKDIKEKDKKKERKGKVKKNKKSHMVLEKYVKIWRWYQLNIYPK